MSKPTQADVETFATKHGISENVVRDILGMPDPVAVTVEAKLDGKNPGKVHFKVDGYEGPVIVDVGGSGFVEKDLTKAGGFSHVFPTGGLKRVRVDAGGTVRWVDIEVGQNNDDSHDEPVEDVPLPIGAPDFSQTLMEPPTAAPEPVEATSAAQPATGKEKDAPAPS